MSISCFDLFSVGIGPSSSHTVGPMTAANRFRKQLQQCPALDSIQKINVELFGSLGLTGEGHGSVAAIALGLLGEQAASVCVDGIEGQLHQLERQGLSLSAAHSVAFDVNKDVILHADQSLPLHPNGMCFSAFDGTQNLVLQQRYYSVGGGFVITEQNQHEQSLNPALPLPFSSAKTLLQHCASHNLKISDVMLRNEKSLRSERDIAEQLMHLWQVMQQCVQRGCAQTGFLPGQLNVKRRANALHKKLAKQHNDALQVLDKVSLWALAVNEENAAGGRVVTAPTNGAAGIMPAVLHYYRFHCDGASDAGVQQFLLTAAAIGILYKSNASISGAEVGCQGEIGSACSMAAAGLTEVLGGSPAQVENAAEIAMEHNLGLTCDPIAGLVQIPCIERNAMAAIKAISAARLALNGDGSHKVSLDEVIQTMRQTGKDMKDEYKETSQAGLAVAVRFVEC